MKWLSLVPCLFALSFLTACDQQETPPPEGLEYERVGSSITITGYTGKTEQLQIPSKIEGYPVTAIGEKAFFGCSDVSYVILPEGVTSIGDWAFWMADPYLAVYIPASVVSIGEGAFAGPGLAYVSSDSASFKMDEHDSLLSKDGKVLYHIGKINTAYTVPQGVTTIASSVAYNHAKLTSISIPDSVTSIGSYAFFGCDHLAAVEFPDGVTSIGESAFLGCRALSAVTLPKGLKAINVQTFEGCDNMKTVTIPEGVTAIGECAFNNCKALTAVILPKSVTAIGDGAFMGCYNLKSLTLPPKLTALGANVTRFCTGLQEIVFTGKPLEVPVPQGWAPRVWKYPSTERRAWQEADRSGRYRAGLLSPDFVEYTPGQQ